MRVVENSCLQAELVEYFLLIYLFHLVNGAIFLVRRLQVERSKQLVGTMLRVWAQNVDAADKGKIRLPCESWNS
jgi:hypothetical protein